MRLYATPFMVDGMRERKIYFWPSSYTTKKTPSNPFFYFYFSLAFDDDDSNEFFKRMKIS